MKSIYHLLKMIFFVLFFSAQIFFAGKTFASVNNSYVPNSVAINTQKAVGEIPVSSTVSQTGAVIYTVPIETYPGVRGMQPQLSLMYNHMSDNGIMGMGWNISGLSSISRGNMTHYYDGITDRISKVMIEGPFYLDGMRLIKQSRTTMEIKYETEQGNIKVTAYLVNGNSVSHFKVLYPNGYEGIFGYPTGTYRDLLNYPLTSMSDKQGNTITYEYTYADNKHKIDKITYGGASVEFSYTSRQDNIIRFVDGLKISENRLLQKIQCKFGTSVLRSYAFTYRQHKNNSVLTQIDYYTGGSLTNATSFNPLKFYYGKNNNAYAYTSSETQLKNWSGSASAWAQPIIKTGRFDYGTEDDGWGVKNVQIFRIIFVLIMYICNIKNISYAINKLERKNDATFEREQAIKEEDKRIDKEP